MLDETYTIPDNLRPFSHKEEERYDAIDMSPLTLILKEKSALNSFSEIIHGKPEIGRLSDGSLLCHMEAENSIELMLRIIQCGTSVKILEPENYRKKMIQILESIIAMYR